MPLTCASCATSTPEPIKPVYPAAPVFMAPIPIPKINLNDNAKVSLAKNIEALVKANNNLKLSRNWYNDLTK